MARRNWSEEDKAEVRRLIHLEHRYRDIAQRFGVSMQALSRMVRRHNLVSKGAILIIKSRRQKGIVFGERTREVRSRNAKRLYQDPAYRSRTLGLSQLAPGTEAAKSRAENAAERRRGFPIPPEHRDAYRALVRSKKASAAEAARMLGFLPDGIAIKPHSQSIRTKDEHYARAKPITIVHDIAEKHGVTAAEIIGQDRSRPVAAARHHAVYEVARLKPDLSLTKIGEVFGGRDHSTLSHSLLKWPQIAAQHGFEVKPLEGRRTVPARDESVAFLEAAE